MAANEVRPTRTFSQPNPRRSGPPLRRIWRYRVAPVLAVIMLSTSLPLFVVTDYLLERSFWFLLPVAAYVALMLWMAHRYLRPPPRGQRKAEG